MQEQEKEQQVQEKEPLEQQGSQGPEQLEQPGRAESKPKKSLAFNVVSKKEHKGFGAGTIDLNAVSCVIIDGDAAYIDIGAMHAKSKVERGIKFSMDKADVPNGRTCWIVWVAVDKVEAGGAYAGAAACEMLIDTEARRGWKILADHVNRLDYAIKRRILVDNLGEREKGLLRDLLIEHNAEWWANSPELQAALEVQN